MFNEFGKLGAPSWDHQGDFSGVEWREHKPDYRGKRSSEMETEIPIQQAEIW